MSSVVSFISFAEAIAACNEAFSCSNSVFTKELVSENVGGAT
jgi:hypothetical protein